MSEPTKEQIEIARALALSFGADLGNGNLAMMDSDFAKLIVKVNNDALERAAQKCHENMMLFRHGSDEFDDWRQGKADGAEECRKDVKTMKEPT